MRAFVLSDCRNHKTFLLGGAESGEETIDRIQVTKPEGNSLSERNRGRFYPKRELAAAGYWRRWPRTTAV